MTPAEFISQKIDEVYAQLAPIAKRHGVNLKRETERGTVMFIPMVDTSDIDAAEIASLSIVDKLKQNSTIEETLEYDSEALQKAIAEIIRDSIRDWRE